MGISVFCYRSLLREGSAHCCLAFRSQNGLSTQCPYGCSITMCFRAHFKYKKWLHFFAVYSRDLTKLLMFTVLTSSNFEINASKGQDASNYITYLDDRTSVFGIATC